MIKRSAKNYDSESDDQYPPSSITSNPSSTASEKFAGLEKYPVITTPDSQVCVCGVQHLDHTLLKNIFEIPLESTVNDLFGDQGQTIYNSSLIESGATVGPVKINIVEKQCLKTIAERGFVFASEISFPDDPSKIVNHRICMSAVDDDFTEIQATVDVSFSKNTKNKKKTTLKQIGKLLGLHRIIQYYLNQEALKRSDKTEKTKQIGGPRKFNGIDTFKILKEQKASERTGLYGTLKRNLNAHSTSSTPGSPFTEPVKLESPSASVQSTVRSLDGYLSQKPKPLDSAPPNTPNISPINTPSISPKSMKTRKPEPPSRKETKRIKAYMFDEPEKYYTPRSFSLDSQELVPTITPYQIPRLMPRSKTPIDNKSAETLTDLVPGQYGKAEPKKGNIDAVQKAYFIFHLFIVVFSVIGFKTFIDLFKSLY